MDRGTWWATVHGVSNELDTTEHTHTEVSFFLSIFKNCIKSTDEFGDFLPLFHVESNNLLVW